MIFNAVICWGVF